MEVGPAAAEVSADQEQLPASLAAVLSDRLSSVSAETEEMLHTAALLRGNIAVTDLAVLTAAMRQALESGDLPRAWHARMLAWLAMFERDGTGGLDTADAAARHALAVAREAWRITPAVEVRHVNKKYVI